jgi:hypothetical protein
MGSASTPSIPLGLLNPGEFFANLDQQSGPGRSYNFQGAMASVMSGAMGAAGYGTVASGLTAAGSGIGNATPITTQGAFFSTVASGTGGQLPPPNAVPYPVFVGNFGVSGLSVYPPTVSGIIGSGSSGVAYTQATGTVVPYYFAGGNQIYHG